jgi:hypothetical protein
MLSLALIFEIKEHAVVLLVRSGPPGEDTDRCPSPAWGRERRTGQMSFSSLGQGETEADG